MTKTVSATSWSLLTPGQAIYGFRGASRSNIDASIEQWSPRVLPLNVNYRSTAQILAVANAIDRTKIGNRRRRLVPATVDQRGPKVTFAETETLPDEARLIVRRIYDRNNDGTPFSEQAILVRTASMARAIETELLARRIPYRLVGGKARAEAAHIKDLLAVFRAVENPRDDLAVTRVLEAVPENSESATATAIAKEIAGLRGPALIKRLRDLSSSRTPNWKGLAEAFRVAARPGRLASKVERVGGNPRADPQGLSRDTLPTSESGWLTLTHSLQLLASTGKPGIFLLPSPSITLRSTEVDNPRLGDHKDKLTISTIYSAKGLEWPVVFIPGLNDGNLACRHALPKAISEERRVLYVAVTRAQHQLHLSRAKFVERGLGSKEQLASRFLDSHVRKQLVSLKPMRPKPIVKTRV